MANHRQLNHKRVLGRMIGLAVAVIGATFAIPVGAGSPVVDTVVMNTNDSGPGSLRQSILNANDHIGPDTVTFAIGSGPQTISVLSPLPPITDPVQISALTQPGFSGQPIIELDGSSAGGGPGLLLAVGHTSVSGLVINRFDGDGIYAAVGFNSITTNYIGTDLSGTVARGNLGNGVVLAGNYASTIGGFELIERNIISGNRDKGIVMVGPSNFNLGSNNNFVAGNYIGVDATGTRALGNRYWGVVLDNTTDSLIGGTRSGTGNVIAGSDLDAVLIVGSGSKFNWVAGNLIGTDAAGTHVLGDGRDGVLIVDASHNRIGGTDSGARNVVSGNGANGIELGGGAATTANIVQGNNLGTDITGTHALPNTLNGLMIANVPGNTVGGPDPGAGNLISGNGENGVFIGGLGGAANRVQGNYIGLNADGTAGIGNAGTAGVLIIDASNNSIGGREAGARNVISGNHHGVYVSGKTATGNLIQGNFIGTDASGRNAVGNVPFHGVAIDGASNNTIGGTAAGASNVISGNGFFGVEVRAGFFAPHDIATGNRIQGNLIGTDVTGTAALGNAAFGVAITNTPNNTVGGTTSAARNVISGNVQAGVLIWQGGSTGNLVEGNYIGSDITGTSPLPNGGNGITVAGGTSNTIGGVTPGAGNLIAFNNFTGVAVSSGTGNSVRGNSIVSNRGLGIDLGGDGITANDRGDGDSGANTLENFPVIKIAETELDTRGLPDLSVDNAHQLVVVGSVDTQNPSTVTIDIYANDAGDPSRHGEGQRLVGSVTPNRAGRFIVILPPQPKGTVISATTTDALGNTSEFSLDVSVGRSR